MKNLNKMNELELKIGVAGDVNRSWHQKYKNSAWVFIGGLPYELSEGDVISAFSQYGEVVNINLIRDRKTGKSKGFCFLCYEDQRSTILAVDNFNGIKLVNRTIRVDHVEEYKVPKVHGDEDPVKLKLLLEGCAPEKPPPPRNAFSTKMKRMKRIGLNKLSKPYSRSYFLLCLRNSLRTPDLLRPTTFRIDRNLRMITFRKVELVGESYVIRSMQCA
ncbi:unnamed protein product [Soboliphyme baturini]|uniref:RRM domain-containing protein n=1 Tax=Soboliphyme baturini TaxID=241478 RepID=A0A183ILQ4_9BILA|nr:unnamed protein product [Soboliphyme baturini]